MSGYWPSQNQIGTRIAPDLAQGPVTGIAENFEAARRDQVLNNNGSSEFILYAQAYGDRITEIEEKTGKKLDNPITSIPLLPGDEIVPGLMRDTRQGAIDEFERNVMRLRDQYPDLSTPDQMEEAIRARSVKTENRAGDLYARAGISGVIGSFGGAVAGSLQDPLVGASLVFGAAKGLSILRTAIYEGLIAGGAETIVQPNIQSGRKERGLEGGAGQALTNIATATGGGAVFGGGVAAISRLISGRAAVKTFDDVVKNPTPEQKAARNLYERNVDIHETSPLDSAAPNALAEHGTRLEAAMRALEDGDPVDLPPPAARLDPEKLAQRADNLDGVVFSFNPDEIEVDAKTFQFKEGGDQYGVTERLQGVEKWDPVKAGQVIVYEYADGRKFIADGHQRLGLARKLKETDQSVTLYGQMFRQAEGFSPEDVRVVAALKNIAEGTGTAVDAAKVLRVDPSRIAELPRNSALVRQAGDLADLSDDAFGLVVNDVVPANYAAIVGRLVKDEKFQSAVLDVLARTDPANVTQAESIVRQAMNAGMHEEIVQGGLFGDELIVSSLFSERAKVLDKTLKRLGQDRKVFDSLVRNQDQIAAEGNVLKADTNAARAQTDARAMQMIQALASRKGPLSDALTAAARRAADEKRYTGAIDDFIGAVRGAVERDDFSGLEAGGAGRALEIENEGPPRAGESGQSPIDDESLELFDAPGGKGVADQTKALDADIREELTAKANDPDELQDIPVGERIDPETSQTVVETRTIKDILDELDQDAADLDAIGKCGAP